MNVWMGSSRQWQRNASLPWPGWVKVSVTRSWLLHKPVKKRSRCLKVYFSNHETCICLNLQTVFLQKDGDLHTPLQSPQPPSIPIHQDKDLLDTLDPTAIADGNYLQCDLCHISCTDSEYLKRHRWGYEMLTYLELWFLFTRRMAHHVDIFKSLEGLVFNCAQCSFSGSNKQSLADHVR